VSALSFELLRNDGPARLGRVTTRHGAFDTPAFMPVGTQGSIKGVLPDQVAATGSQIILANTYHLARPHPHRQRRIPGVFTRGH
jgi:queuine tRNA-ribosyltransferase